MYQSIVRNGNHFINLGTVIYRSKWLLIDGPWFDYLEKINKREGSDELVFRPYHKISRVPLEEDCLPQESYHPEFIFWERMEVPYYTVGKRQLTYSIDQVVDLAKRMSNYSDVYYNALDNILMKRTSFMAWQCNHGVLPAWLKNEHWDENLEELFSFITYELKEFI